MIFQITALSRSGTAFMAAFFSLHPECIAHHDLAGEREDWWEHSERLERTWRFVAEVSTYGWLKRATRPRIDRKVFIERDPDEVFSALWKRTEEEPCYTDIHFQHKIALQWAISQGALVVPFSELFSINRLQQIWWHIFHDYTFPLEKAELFIKLNIQRQEINTNADQMAQRLFAA